MADVKPSPFIDSLSGKASRYSNIYYRTNRITGKTCTCRVCHKASTPTAAQDASRSLFAAASTATKLILTVNDNSEYYQKRLIYKTEFEPLPKSTRGSFSSFVFKKEYAALKNANNQ